MTVNCELDARNFARKVDSRNTRFPTRLKLTLPSSGLLRSVRWVDTDVSVLPIGPIFKGQTVQLESSTLEDGTDIQSRNVGIKSPYAV